MQVLCGLQVLFLLFNCQTPGACTELSGFLYFPAFRLPNLKKSSIILSLTVVGGKNRCIPCVYWATAVFTVVSNYSNLFLTFAFFLDCSHFTFGYELVVCPETAGFMKIIRDLFPLVQWDESLLLYPGKIHRF